VPNVGDRAPDFSLPGTSGDVRLRELLGRGPVLLAFYVEDATPGCSTQLQSLIDAHDILSELGVHIVAVSADSVESHHAFAERLGGVPFPLASDAGTAVAQQYNAVSEDDRRRSCRALFVVDQDGTIAYAANPYSVNSTRQLEEALQTLGVSW
jgi:peroxiredoxin Q/BCP